MTVAPGCLNWHLLTSRREAERGRLCLQVPVAPDGERGVREAFPEAMGSGYALTECGWRSGRGEGRRAEQGGGREDSARKLKPVPEKPCEQSDPRGPGWGQQWPEAVTRMLHLNAFEGIPGLA